MLCASNSATMIRVTMDDDEAAPESLSSLSSSSSSNTPTNPSSSSLGFGRAIDRHNPIIRDGRRISTASSTSRRTNNTSLLIPTPSSTRASSSSTAAPNTTATTHKINHMTNTKLVTVASEFSELLANNNNNKKKKKNRKNTDSISTITSVHSGGSGGGCGGGAAVINKKKQISSQGGGWGCKNPGDFISPPSFSSSRYLLSSHEDAAFLSNDPIIALEPVASASNSSLHLPAANFNKLDEHQFTPPLAPTSYIPVKPPPPSSPPSDPSQHQQVVVLKVSLHCRGCERKMRKHISRMEGVTSFDIDFAAKKVMVVGNVTPLAVLASVSKVKNAQLLNPTISSSSPPTVAKASNYLGTVKRQGILV